MKHTDKQIIEGIKKGGREKEAMVSSLYTNNKDIVFVAKFIKLILDNGKREEAYNDAILGCVEKIEQDKFRGDSRIRTFLSTIFERRCKDAFRTTMRDKLILGSIDPEIQGFIEPKIDFERIGLLEAIFKNCYKYEKKKTCDSCKKILYDWANGYSMKEIAQRNKIKNEDAAKVKKGRYLKIIREINNEQL